MTERIAADRFFKVGGTMDADAPSYVERHADRELIEHLLADDFCSVLSPRQMGKSSLIARAAAQLGARSVECLTVDLQGVVTASMAPDEFYLTVLRQIASQIERPMTLLDLRAWWAAHAGLTVIDRFAIFLEDEVLARARDRVTVFIDEIDRMRSVAFSDDFFGCLRALYNARARKATLRRLAFVLCGAAAPRDLVKDPNRSPFNIGYSVELTDFSCDEAAKLASPWGLGPAKTERLLTRVLYWTGGHPYLTHRVCAEVAEARPKPGSERDVDRMVDALFFSERTWEDYNLDWVRSALVGDAVDALDLYAKVRGGEVVADDKRSDRHVRLKLTGIVRVNATGRPRLRLANRIYEEVFDRDWVESLSLPARPVTSGSARRRETYVGPAPRGRAEALAVYCRWLAGTLGSLPLRGLDVNAGEPGTGREPLGLAEVYIDLETTTQVAAREQDPRRRGLAGDLRDRRLSALEAAAGHRALVLLGEPGSGKSTFLNHLAFCLASHTADPGGGWRGRLRGWPSQVGDLIPIPVVLRDFARSMTGAPSDHSDQSLWAFIEDRLRQENLSFVSPHLKESLEQGNAVVLLDGLDEIPTRAGRQATRAAVEEFIRRYAQSRHVVTCRTLSYEEPGARLTKVPVFQLAPFDTARIGRFVDAWYGELVRLGQVKAVARSGLAGRLREAVNRGDLRWMASNPLLLTVMALVHTYKGVLPDARAQLYEDTVDLLLSRWEQVRMAGEDEMPPLRGLLAEAHRGDVDLKRALWRLAFEVHAAGGGDAERLADIDEAKLLSALAALHPDRSRNWARRLVDVIRLRAGLLLERAPGVYTFPHRTFQEYLAGAELSSRSDFARASTRLLDEGPFWRQVILLAVGRLTYVTADSDKPLALVGELCPVEVRDDAASWRKVWVAGEALVEMGVSRAGDSQLGADLLSRVRLRLRQLVERGRLSAMERVAAGNALGKLGDPRFREDAWFLPDDALLGFVEIPAAPFVMGSPRSDKRRFDAEINEHEVELPRYYLARYPVTVAQFKAFADDKLFEPRDSDWQQGLANHPVVAISWHEARAYCDWLTEQLRASDRTPRALADLLHGRTPDKRKWRVTLPSEAEWEKAARGPAPSQRVYPWVDEPDPDAANYDATGIGATSPVGCFPKGASQPYGVLDLAGNAWEWTRSLWGKDFAKSDLPGRYVPGGPAENLEASDDVPRVLRGGAFDLNGRFVRCAVRVRNHPLDRYGGIGFRVAVSPFVSDP